MLTERAFPSAKTNGQWTAWDVLNRSRYAVPQHPKRLRRHVTQAVVPIHTRSGRISEVIRGRGVVVLC
jgi:hypothetical protein